MSEEDKTLTANSDKQVWGYSQAVDELFYPVDMCFSQKAMLEISIPLATMMVTKAVRNLQSAKAAEVDEIQAKMLKALDKIEVAWLIRLFSDVWKYGAVPLDWKTEMVVPGD